MTGDAARMQGAIEQIVRRGRSRGIGLTMITQRSAVLSKDILTQADVLVVMRTTGPHDQAAVKAWIDAHDDDQADVVNSLASLETGEAWIWNPERSVLKRVRIRRRSTFDSSSTPKAGERRADPKTAAAIDLTALGAEIQATAERAKENDPAELRKRVRELEEQLRRSFAAGQKPRTIVTETIVEVVPEVDFDPILEAVMQLDDALRVAQERLDVAKHELGRVEGRLDAARLKAASREPEVRARDATTSDPRPPRTSAPALEEPPARPRPPAAPAAGVSGPQQRILNAIAVLEQLGVPAPDKTQVALLAEASPRSSAFANNLGALRNQLGLIEYPAGGRVQLTDAGRTAADAGAAPSTVQEMHRFVAGLVGGAKWRLLEQLIVAYPDPLGKDDLAERAGASATSSAFANNLGSLRNSFALIEYPGPGLVKALPILFLED